MKKAKLFMMLALLVMGVSNLFAQNVTISPTSGSLLAALTYDGEVGAQDGWSAMWRHEQLPLTFTVGDYGDLTDGGELTTPGGDLGEYNGRLIVGSGSTVDTYMALSLPKGYRITGYKIVVLNDCNGKTILDTRHGNIAKTLYETNNDFNTSNYLAKTDRMPGTNDTKEYVIERNSVSEDDMGNHLYFRMTHETNGFYAVTIKSFEVWFTAEGTFPVEVKPSEMGQARSVVTSPFLTSKIDVGDMKVETMDNGNKFFVYDYKNVRDLTGYNTIYQSDAVANGVPAEVSEAKTIYPVHVDDKDLYAFGNNTYFIEPPVMVHTQTGLEAPVGYRIVGARFNCLWGTATSGDSQTQTSYYITYTYNGTPYYLNDQLHFTTNKFGWQRDSNGNLYVTTGRYLSCGGNANNYRPITWSTEADSRFNLKIDSDGNIYYRTGNGNYFYLEFYDQNRNVGTGVTPIMARYNSNYYSSNYLATSTYETTTETIPAFNPGAYTLKVYDKEGNYEEDSEGKPTKGLKAVVNSKSDAGGILELDKLNNDAVKFQISGLPDDGSKQALVSITLLLEALDPYIDKMDLVCHDPDNQLELAQSFTANDFSVSGGAFNFYIPKDYEDTELTFTFRDLYSKYGDNTYYTGTADQKDGNARYSFVTSDYFFPVNGKDNGGLYDDAYDPDASYTSKILTSTAGNIRFKFNNAEDLGNNQTGTGYLEETPFSVKDYLGSKDPDGTTKKGAFIDCKLKASDDAQKSGTYFVFTADETRYNIAPTTAWQHRSYAFYRMDITLVAKNYTPDLTWKKLYNNTFYTDDSNAILKKSMWGVEVATKDENNKKVTGYLTVKNILDAIDADIENTSKVTAEGTDQILYIDGSELYSILNTKQKKLVDLKTNLGTNALVFLPANTTSTLDNFAYKTTSGSFRAGKDIVITDKRPFFSPYDIQVDPANWAKYDRQITYTGYNPIKHATIVLPFTIDVDKNSGIHHNEDNDGVDFTLATMNETNNKLVKKDGSNYDYFADVYFTTLKETSQANIPYIVTLESAGEDAFKAHCKGSLVKATTDNGVFEGETASGEFEGAKYTFTNTGTYTGKEVGDETKGGAAAAEEKVFYFGNNYFLDSKTLKAPKSVKILPFRSFYEYKATGNAKMSRFYIAFGENPNMGDTNGITDVQRDADLAVIPGKGIITLIARAEKDVTIHAVSGITVDKCSLNAGETRTVSVPAGVYVINGVKMVVK